MPRTRKQHYPSKLINYSYSKKIIRRCMEKYSLLTKLAKCTLNIALKLTFSVFLFFVAFWRHFRPPRHCQEAALLNTFFWATVFSPRWHLGEKLSLKKRLWLEWIPQNQGGHLMFITQRYTQRHAILYLGEFIGRENFKKSGEIRVRDSCARRRVEYRV